VAPTETTNKFKLQLASLFSKHFSEKKYLDDKIPAFLQAFEDVISANTTEQSGIWVELSSDVIGGTEPKGVKRRLIGHRAL